MNFFVAGGDDKQSVSRGVRVVENDVEGWWCYANGMSALTPPKVTKPWNIACTQNIFKQIESLHTWVALSILKLL